MVRLRFEMAKGDGLPGVVVDIDRRLPIDLQPEHRTRFDRVLVQEHVVAVQIYRHAQRCFGRRDTGDMIDMRVGEEDMTDREVAAGGKRQEALHFIARIDVHGFACVLAADDEAVLHERPHGAALDYHDDMVLAVLDDLMFSSKMKTAATQLGVTLAFARSSAAALDEMRKSRPSLVILDLNNPRTDPMGIVAAMKSDASLAGIPTLGYVSHVDTAVIAAARQAGVSEVLARSAFAADLPAILKRT